MPRDHSPAGALRLVRYLAMVVVGLLALGAGGAATDASARVVDDRLSPAQQARAQEAGQVGGSGLRPRLAASGSVQVTLHPGPQARIGNPTVVSFGAPFPPGVLTGADQLSVLGPDGSELRSHAADLLPWRDWPGGETAASVRAAMVSVEVTFPSRDPLQVTLRYGT
ncbi:MAG: hypothetical protein ACRDP8_12540, partial [Actinopolymorphaceae bacterium]